MSKAISEEQSMTDAEAHDLAVIHHGYVKELAKLKWLAESMKVRSNDFCNKCPDIGGLELLLVGMTESMQALNDDLDHCIYKRRNNIEGEE
jgi:hypothetical protein